MIDTDPALFDGGRKLPLVEDFYTIQGEGFHAGKPAYFIRLGGCDVGCRWCDAKYTWNPRRYPPVDVQVVIDRALSCPARAIVITAANRCSIRSTYLRGPCTTEDCKFFSKRRARIRSAAVSTGCASRPNGSNRRWTKPSGERTS